MTPTKRIAGGYEMVQSEGGSYSISKTSLFKVKKPEDVDPLDGDVSQVGWNDAYLAFLRRDSRGSAGWIVINLRDHRVDGPLTEEAFSRRRASEPGLATLVLHSAEEAWKLR